MRCKPQITFKCVIKFSASRLCWFECVESFDLLEFGIFVILETVLEAQLNAHFEAVDIELV